MPTIKQIAKVAALTLATTAAAAIIAFLNEVHLEISFDKLRGFKVTDLESYAKLFKAINMQFEITSEQDYVAYWVDDESGKPIVRKSNISYKNFRLNNRMAGRLTDQDDSVSYAITGYYNSNRIVFSHRGPISGTGVYVLDLVPIDGTVTATYAGYAIIEGTVASGAALTRLFQCPMIMLNEDTAAKKFPSEDVARKAFPILNGSCIEFKMFSNVTTASAN